MSAKLYQTARKRSAGHSRFGVTAACAAVVEGLEGRLLLAAHIVGDPTVYPTIQSAVNAAAKGAVINIDPGVYPELVAVTQSVTINGAQAGVDPRTNARQTAANESIVEGYAVSDGTSSGFYIEADDVTINGFTVKGETSTLKFGAGIVIAPDTSGTHILNNILTDNQSGLFLANSSATDQSVIQYNVFQGNNNPGEDGGRGIYSDDSLSGGVLQNVVIDSNFFNDQFGDPATTTGLEAGIALESSSVTPGSQTNIQITNNTFDDNGKALLAYNASYLTITGNTITSSQDSGSGALRFEGGVSNVTISNNNIFNNLDAAVHIDTKGFGVDNSAFAINNNNFTGNGYGYEMGSLWVGPTNDAQNPPLTTIVYDGSLDATNNWWNDASGPSGDGPGSGDASTANVASVTISPWATSAAVAQESPLTGLAALAGYPIQAENFDQGLGGIAYHTGNPLNSSSLYRDTGVKLQSTTDTGGGYDVTGLSSGQWLNYMINVPQAGTYQLNFRVATSQTTGGKFQVNVDGVNATGSITVPGTGGNQAWTTISSGSFSVAAGSHVLQLLVDSNGTSGTLGNLNWLDLTPYVAPTTVPSAPTNLAAVATATQVALTWANSATNQTGFEIDRSTDDKTFTKLTTLGMSSTTYTNAGLLAGQTYYYRVEATNSIGLSLASNIAMATTPAPIAPTGLKATAASTSQINLSWTNAAAGLTGFNVERGTDGVHFASVGTTASGVVAYSDTVGLAAGTIYYYEVLANGGSTSSTPSNIASATTLKPAAPAAPTTLGAVPISAAQINITWVSPASVVTGFIVERSTDDVTFAQIGTTGAAVLSYPDSTGLAAGKTYYYEVLATGAGGNSLPSSVASATTPAISPVVPAAPTALKATPASATQINLAWTSAATGVTGFIVKRSTDDVTFAQIGTTGAAVLSYPDSTGLAAGKTYYYEVLATGAGGNSLPSSVASATTPAISPVVPAAPTALKATPASATQINLTWTSAATGVTGFIVKRSTDDVTFAQIGTTGAAVLSYPDSAGLAAGKTYYYEVLAVGAGGNSLPSNVASAIIASTTPAKPVAPTALKAAAGSTTQINLAWASAATGVSGFIVERSSDNVNFAETGTTGAGVLSYVDSTGLTAGKTYYFQVLATGPGGNSAPSGVASATTPATTPPKPAAPTALKATAASATQINLGWASTGVGETGFLIERSTNGSQFVQVGRTPANMTSFADVTGLAAGATYYYEVLASGPGGNSPASNVVSAMTIKPTSTVYLSSLNWVSATSGWNGVHKNASVDSKTITLRGKTYAQGIGVNAVSTIVYNLAGSYSTFQSDIGIDDETKTEGVGAAIFQVIGDGKVLYTSSVLKVTSPIVTVNIDVKGVKTLTLKVNNGIANTWAYDHADWAGAKLS